MRLFASSFTATGVAALLFACSSNGTVSYPSLVLPDAAEDAAADVGTVADASPAQDASSASDAASPNDAGTDADKAAACASSFGSGLTDAFGRIDGTVVAVVPPNDQACAMPNATHLVVQVKAGGAVYRMVVDVLSNRGNPDVSFYELDAPLAGGAWSEGWHPNTPLDYVSTLNVHSGPFTAMHEADLVAKITSEIDVGANVSIFATSQNSPSSAHLVHRNQPNADGAIVVRPDTAQPHYMLLRFDEQSF